MFVKTAGDPYEISVIPGSSHLPRYLTDLAAAIVRITVPSTIAGSIDDVQVHVLNFDGTGTDDVFIIGKPTTAVINAGDSPAVAGYLFLGDVVNAHQHGAMTESDATLTLMDDANPRPSHGWRASCRCWAFRQSITRWMLV